MNIKLANDRLQTELNKSSRRGVTILLSVTLLLFALAGQAQNKTLNYRILRDDNQVGTLRFTENILNGTDSLKMESNVKTKFVFTFKALIREYATFSNGILLRSSIYRQFNGTEKVNKQHEVSNKQYIIYQGKKTKVITSYPITYNMLSFYSREPENISKVYSDKLEAFLTVQKINAHQYRVNLPDGNYNLYSYQHGVLSLVEVHHSMYSAKIVLMNN
jgi:hypothetical protein